MSAPRRRSPHGRPRPREGRRGEGRAGRAGDRAVAAGFGRRRTLAGSAKAARVSRAGIRARRRGRSGPPSPAGGCASSRSRTSPRRGDARHGIPGRRLRHRRHPRAASHQGVRLASSDSLLGPPGTGKSRFARRVGEVLAWPSRSTGARACRIRRSSARPASGAPAGPACPCRPSSAPMRPRSSSSSTSSRAPGLAGTTGC